MSHECKCETPALLPLREPWYPANGFNQREEDPNVWCALCGDAWKAPPETLAATIAEAEKFDRENAYQHEETVTAKRLDEWEAWVKKPWGMTS